MGSPEEGRRFFDDLWPEARAVSDPEKQLYRAFGLARGGAAALFGPGVWLRGLGSARKGHRIGRPVGDPFMMPGAFLVDESGRVAWEHAYRHAGDHPDFSSVVGAVR
jgi:hypothetical protein